MAITGKDARIINELDDPGSDEPLIVFRAKDALAIDLLDWYAVRAGREGCSHEFVAAVDARRREFARWQADNGDRVKLPD